MKIRKNDQVKILSGKDKGKLGKVLLVVPAKNRVVVEGVNFITKKKDRTKKQKGVKTETVRIENWINVSNVELMDTKSGKPTRVGFEVKDGKKIRISRKSKIAA